MPIMPEGYFPDGYEPDGYLSTASRAPVLTVSLSGLVATATITGDAEATLYLLYRSPADIDWQDGGNRVGSGDLTVSGLLANTVYTFLVYSEENGNRSLPSIPVNVQTARDTAIAAAEFATDGLVFMLMSAGEEITYYPPAGGSRRILALVDRLGPADLPGEGSAEGIRAVILNDPIEGISSTEINVGKSMLGIPRRPGLAEVQRVVTLIENIDAVALQVLAG
jgi:hypothetical protein